MNESFTYPGGELELFQHAINWKRYFANQLKPYIKGNVLEVGAGLGATTILLNKADHPRWVLLEPDANMYSLLTTKKVNGELPANCEVKQGIIASIQEKFDTIIYIDVLEHIENDKEELLKASKLLNAGGHVIVLSPAFPYLYSPFDKAIGHYRRYTKRMLVDVTPKDLKIVHNKYYDNVGFFASVVNKMLLRQKYPTEKQVLFWDRWMVPVSKISDKLSFHSFGKSIICIWVKV